MNQQKEMKQMIIVVLGMHRSGTSAITRGLQTLGVDLGENLLEAVANNNERGFWEDVDILDINMRLLARMGCSWETLPIMSSDQINATDLVDLFEEAKATLEKKIQATALFGVKDPRLSLLLPFWKEVFTALSLDARYIIVVRHPLAVATSLKRRDGFEISKSLELWLAYTQNAIALTANDKRVFIDYDSVLENPEWQLQRVADLAELPMPDANSPAILEYKNDFLTTALNHFVPDESSLDNDILWRSAVFYTEVTEKCHFPDDVNSKNQAARQNIRLYAAHVRDNVAELEDALQQKNAEIIELKKYEANITNQKNIKISELKKKEDKLIKQLELATLEIRNVRAEVTTILASTSWRVSAPLRLIKHFALGNHQEAASMLFPLVKPIAKALLYKIPSRHRPRIFALMHAVANHVIPGFLQPLNKNHLNEIIRNASLTCLDKLPSPKLKAETKIAVHIHLFYTETADLFANALNKMPCTFSIFISTKEGADLDKIRKIFSRCKRASDIEIRETHNIGRDIYPFICLFGEKLKNYDFIAHLHSKKSLYNNGATDGWLEYIVDSLFDSEDAIARIFGLLSEENSIGIVYPQNFHGLPYMANSWLANRPTATKYQTRFGLNRIPSSYFDYPAGSMFWARADAMLPLFNAGITENDFEKETGQTDGTLAHCIERMLVLIAHQTGFRHAILADSHNPSWSPWRFDQYFSRTHASTLNLLLSSQTDLVIFDIFDTLLSRPLVDPDTIKHLVAACTDLETGKRYLDFRNIAEHQARLLHGKDVNIGEIFQELTTLARFDSQTALKLQILEEDLEFASVMPRIDTIALFNAAVQSGKRVILASDMFLCHDTLERMLEKCGVAGWTRLYVSNASGLRKDNGKLYEHILNSEATLPSSTLMIGDNERSDFQIPCDMGIKFLHVLKPTDIARASTRFSLLLSDYETTGFDLDQELLLGSLIRYNFGQLFYEQFSPENMFLPSPEAIGYSVLGPVVACFVHWLTEINSQHDTETLYFLAREGEFIKEMYDLWRDYTGAGPTSTYLVVSRRTVTVAAIKTLTDIINIAEQTYFSNTLHNYLEERFGITLNEEELVEICAKGLWKKGALVEIFDKGISHILPLLQHLEPRILQQSRREEEGLQYYLEQSGIYSTRHPFVVDVGYAATIQTALCKLTNRKTNGLYMLTNKRAEYVRDQTDAIVEACFANFLPEKSIEPKLYSRSFELEKLLSSSNAQVIRYICEPDGQLQAEFRSLSSEEKKSMTVREKIRNGARKFMSDHIEIRKNLHTCHSIPKEVVIKIYDYFTNNFSPAEQHIMKQLALDDFYCGRGIVS